MDLRDDIERELAGEPVDLFRMDDALVAGRSALRRRRVLTLVAGAAAVVALGSGLTVALNLGQSPVDADRVASQGDSDECAQGRVSAGQSGSCNDSESFLQENAVGYTPSGRLIVRSGWDIVDEVDNPLGEVPATAVAVSNSDRTEWAVLKKPGGPGGGSLHEHVNPANLSSALTFDAWVRYEASRFLGTPATNLVRFGADGDLRPLPGWSIEQQANDVTLPAGYRGPSGVTAVISLDDAPGVWFLVRPAAGGSEGQAEAFPVIGAGTSIASVLTHTASAAYDPDRQGLLAPVSGAGDAS
ncbi:hypothetical protein SAMN04489844_1472 [Nocardioides exalbidus]|uniref:Uncharacterized protein n=1 Tax=Nocardioides exalbidus TaxID=402596 RepID=A0A1H4NWN3_9ACTN|nr:hypothetical protein [Nocardioides exalbidus]SEB99593.1 hypothetical protein SAMN04489844_1472 [Nocardioides exalbidus]